MLRNRLAALETKNGLEQHDPSLIHTAISKLCWNDFIEDYKQLPTLWNPRASKGRELFTTRDPLKNT